ncbi:MAG: amidohydrolase family protein [Planctomycetota bacterium]
MSCYATAIALATIAGSTLAAQEAPSIDVFFGQRPKEYKVAQWGPDSFPTPAYAFRAARVLTAEGPPIRDGVVLTRDKKIVAVGPAAEIDIPVDYEVVDLGDRWVMPGLVDLHCHIASTSGRDINDTVHSINPELRTVDLVTIDHERMRDALAGGVTTVLFIPGSGSNMGGFGSLTKTHGTPEEALVRFPGSLKIAQAGNPERRAGDLGATRMGMNQGLRFALERGQRYWRAWEDFDRGEGPAPEPQPDLEYLRGLFRHEYPVTVHTQIYQVVLETLRELRDEFGLWTVIDHGTFDAYRLCEDALVRGVPVCNGPRQYHFERETGRFVGLADAWFRGGLHGWQSPVKGLGVDGIAVNTDSPVVAQEQLTLQCAMAVRLGLPWRVGLAAITINPARFVGADHRVGSLRAGKDADLVAWSGDPLDPRSFVDATIVNGRIAYRRTGARPRF